MKDAALRMARKILENSMGYHHSNDEDIEKVLHIIDAALANKWPLNKDYISEDLQKALDRGRDMGRSERPWVGLSAEMKLLYVRHAEKMSTLDLIEEIERYLKGVNA